MPPLAAESFRGLHLLVAPLGQSVSGRTQMSLLTKTQHVERCWPPLGSRGLCKYEFPPVSLLAQTLCKIREDEEADPARGAILAHSDLEPRADAPRDTPPRQIPMRKDLLTQRRGTL